MNAEPMIPPGKKIRVLVVDDSAFMRKVLHTLISSDPQMEVVGQARDGREAVTLAESLKPDVIAMDIRMPRFDGLQATELIMSRHPRPIVIVSSESRDGAEDTLRALALGAIEFVAKPSGGVDLDMNTVRDELLRKLRMASKVRVVRNAARSKVPEERDASALASEATCAQPLARSIPHAKADFSSHPLPTDGRFPVVVIAASTGGPATLIRFLPNFPKNFPAALFLVLHMPANFTAQFGQQLAEICAMQVKEAEDGERVQPGVIYLCPGSRHLRLSEMGRVALESGPRIAGYLPCADVTLETAAAFAGPMTIGVVLTGMGNDASRGVQAVKSAGGHVIAQDESSSVIFGMPAEAIKTGAVHQVLTLDRIYPAIEKRVLRMYSAGKVETR